MGIAKCPSNVGGKSKGRDEKAKRMTWQKNERKKKLAGVGVLFQEFLGIQKDLDGEAAHEG